MKTFTSLPKTEANQSFYNRYATLIPTLGILGYLSQIVSALTEFGVIYSIIYASLSEFWPDRAGAVALAGAVVGTLFLELGLRKFLPYSARAVIHRRYKGWDGWISAFVLAATVGLIAASGLLSFQGSRSLVEAVAPPPAVLTTTAVDSLAAAGTAAAGDILKEQRDETRRRYAALIDAANQSAGATVRELDGQLTALRSKETRTGKNFTTRRGQLTGQLERVTAERDRKTAQLTADRANALAALQTAHTAKIDLIQGDQRTERQKIDATNQRAASEMTAKVNGYGGGLAYFTLFCLLVLIVAVTIKELHHAGADIEEQVEPGAYDFEAGPYAAFLTALGGRWQRFIYGLIHRIEKGTTDAPEPVAAPTVWSRDNNALRVVHTQGVGRKTAATGTGEPRRQIGFKTPPEITGEPAPDASEAPEVEDALTQCVSDAIPPAPDASEKAPAAGEIGRCDHCGTDYEKRTTWQRFCQAQCRKDFHAAAHGGREFDPNFKAWKDAK